MKTRTVLLVRSFRRRRHRRHRAQSLLNNNTRAVFETHADSNNNIFERYKKTFFNSFFFSCHCFVNNTYTKVDEPLQKNKKPRGLPFSFRCELFVRRYTATEIVLMMKKLKSDRICFFITVRVFRVKLKIEIGSVRVDPYRAKQINVYYTTRINKSNCSDRRCVS